MSHPGKELHREGRSRQEARADRILDTASALILRWGYNKTTIDDIAREAGVAKGTIYLHWKTREELFLALLKRERLLLSEDVGRRVAADPAGATLRRMLRHSAIALFQRPLLKAVLLHDIEVLGKLAHSEHSQAAYTERLAGFQTYLEFLGEHGLVRTDLSMRAQLYMVNAIFMGFFLIMPLMPDDLKLTDEEVADLMAETIHRTFEFDHANSSDALRAVSDNFMQYLQRDITLIQQQLQDNAEA